MNFVLDKVENNVRKGENAGYQLFLLFPTMFSNAIFLGLLKVIIVLYRMKWIF